jgi:hypothetical protein
MVDLLPSAASMAAFRRKIGDPGSERLVDCVFAHSASVLKGRVDRTEPLTDRVGLAYLEEGREIFTINVIKGGLRLYFHPAAGLLFSDEEDYGVGKVSLWSSSFQKSTGKYRGMSAWVTNESHLAGAKALIDRIAGG